MQLSKRMQRLASLVTEENRLADIGTDHGYIPIYLIQQKKIQSALAMDINSGPLSRAKEHIEASRLTTYIETRLSDGLCKLEADEADTVLIAGMGGMLMVSILNGGAHCLDTVKELILQPQSDIQEVRRWLYRHNYRIIVEDIVFEDGKYYPMMKAIHGQDEKFSDEELYYGRTSQQRSKEVLLSYLQKKAYDGKKIQEILQKNGQEHSVRMKELKKDEKRIRRFVKKLTEPSSVVSKKEEMS